MNISAPFIRRPVGTTLLTIAVALVGAVAFRFLPVAALPTVALRVTTAMLVAAVLTSFTVFAGATILVTLEALLLSAMGMWSSTVN